MHLLDVAQLCGAMWANRGMSFDFARVSGIEFAVDERVHQEAGFFAVHRGVSSASALSQASRSMLRARASRDITVPTGAPTISAMSR